jgi:hypothetical protein
MTSHLNFEAFRLEGVFQATVSTMSWVSPGDHRSIGQQRRKRASGSGDLADVSQLILDTTAVSWSS